VVGGFEYGVHCECWMSRGKKSIGLSWLFSKGNCGLIERKCLSDMEERKGNCR
jgi:hypothetical protein